MIYSKSNFLDFYTFGYNIILSFFSDGLINVILDMMTLELSLDLVLVKMCIKPQTLIKVELISKELWMAGTMKLSLLTID